MSIVRKSLDELLREKAANAGLTVEEWRDQLAKRAMEEQAIFEAQECERVAVSLKLSPDAVSAFQASGPGHTLRMAEILEAEAERMMAEATSS